MFDGISVAMATPFRDGKLDEEGIERLLAHLHEGRVDGVVPAGCTGEAATLTLAERETLVRACVRSRRPGSFVLAGAGTNATETTKQLVERAAEWGADGVLLITPYYNKPTQSGLLAHFREIAKRTSLPIMLYNVPGRTGVRLEPETIARLGEVENIVAVKEACGSLDQVSELCRTTSLSILSGDDSLTLPMLAVGATGVVSVAGNLHPRALGEMIRAHTAGRVDRAREIHQRLLPLFKGLFLESNPGPVKNLLARRGLIADALRLPLVPVEPETADRLAKVAEEVERSLGELDLS
ncbi:MAG: 4-hydroxy-tetrahydrodipicolinate synthase [Candidatus Eisenbacteria bacterium]|nr:4-hydroxy-tetrahydrodipicolinate synthase [Candidatus Latescibacterota bacterium]MBD3301831.1 4-hydroxy-tetrahydrodipicolinate synthase [Candidatus Eisenbacteria bacterium]